MERDKINGELNQRNENAGCDNPVGLKNIVRLPSNKNGILIMFNDDLSNPIIYMTEHLWDILKAMEEQEFLFIKELNCDKLSIHIYMERSN